MGIGDPMCIFCQIEAAKPEDPNDRLAYYGKSWAVSPDELVGIEDCEGWKTP